MHNEVGFEGQVSGASQERIGARDQTIAAVHNWVCET
jgi:hypothetical protein